MIRHNSGGSLGGIQREIVVMFRSLGFSCLCVAVLWAGSGPARAQDDVQGFNLGAFSFLPAVRTSVTYDDNVFASDTGKVDDFVFVVAPSTELKSNFSRHMLNIRGYASSAFYADETSEDNTAWGTGLDARVDVFDGFTFDVGFDYDQFKEQRTSPDIPLDSAEIGRQEEFVAEGTFEHKTGWFFYAVNAGTSDTQYDDLDSILGGEIDQDFRDRRVVWVGGKFGADLSDALRVFASYSWNDTNYDKAPPEADFDRDSDGYGYGVGIEFDEGGTLSANLYAGYVLQDYDDDDRNLKEGEALAVRADIDWQLAPDTLVRIDGERQLEEAAGFQESGRLTSNVEFEMSHELAEKILLRGGLGYTHRDYIGTVREDDDYVASLTGVYLLNPCYQFELGYRYTERDSNAAGRAFQKNLVTLALVTRI